MRRVWIALAAGAMACTWVPLSDEGSEVRVARPAEVTACEKLGETRANTRTSAGIFARGGGKVEQELEALARNEAAELGGDTIVATGPVTAEGTRRFAIYRCP